MLFVPFFVTMLALLAEVLLPFLAADEVAVRCVNRVKPLLDSFNLMNCWLAPSVMVEEQNKLASQSPP